MKNIAPALVLSLGLGFTGAANATCKTGCPGTPTTGTGTQTVDVSQQTNVKVEANPVAISGSNSAATVKIDKGAIQNTVAPVIKGSTANATIAEGAVKNNVNAAATIQEGAVKNNVAATIQEGAVKNDNTNLNKNDNTSSATIEKGAVQTGDQNVIINGPKIPKGPVNSAIAPTIISSGGSVGISTPDNPYASCYREKTDQRSVSLAVTVYTASLSGGISPEKEDSAECIQRVDKLIADRRLEGTGRSGQAAVVRRDLGNPINIDLKKAVDAGKTLIAGCPHADPVEYELTGICPAAPVTENVKKFTDAATAAPVAAPPATCPPGTRRDPVTLECKRG